VGIKQVRGLGGLKCRASVVTEVRTSVTIYLQRLIHVSLVNSLVILCTKGCFTDIFLELIILLAGNLYKSYIYIYINIYI
jgi:hypothetical protein